MIGDDPKIRRLGTKTNPYVLPREVLDNPRRELGGVPPSPPRETAHVKTEEKKP